MLFFKEFPPFIDIQVWVKPGSSKETIMPPDERGLIIYIHAKPQDGLANDAVRSLIAKWLQLPKSQVTLLRGEKSRKKCIRIPHQLTLLNKLEKISSSSIL